MQTTVTITIGRNYGAAGYRPGKRMGADTWASFQATITEILEAARATIYVKAASSTGEWLGESEDSATWVASTGHAWLENLRVDLEAACRTFGQDAIALTIGQTELVEARS